MVIATPVTMLAHARHLAVTAESVETPEQAERPRTIGVNRGSGYSFARPLDPDSAEALLRAQSAQCWPAGYLAGGRLAWMASKPVAEV